MVVGYNMDWEKGGGLVTVNKRNVQKTAPQYSNLHNEQPVSWTSHYGSVTFNCCKGPSAGMNEAGLTVHALMLVGTEYPAPDSRPYISTSQWVQYQLDNFSTVEQVIASDSQLRISNPPPRTPRSHYFVCDRTGNCASIEYIDGKMFYHTKETMPAKALANSTYEQSLTVLKQHVGWSGDSSNLQNQSSLDRFVRAAGMVKNYDPKTSESVIDYAFNILAKLKWSIPTQWSIVHDIPSLRIYFRTRENQKNRIISFSSIDFSSTTPVKGLDINADLSGDVTKKFNDYTYKINRNFFK
jgi:choloylglycine hydrolase